MVVLCNDSTSIEWHVLIFRFFNKQLIQTNRFHIFAILTLNFELHVVRCNLAFIYQLSVVRYSFNNNFSISHILSAPIPDSTRPNKKLSELVIIKNAKKSQIDRSRSHHIENEV